MTWDRHSLPAGLATLLEEMEGFSATPYDDNGKLAGGTWTIGIGSTRDINGRPVTPATPPISHEDAIVLLQRDLEGCIASVANDVRVPITEGQAAALISLSYNIGDLSTAAPSLMALVNSNRHVEAANRFGVYRNQGGAPVLGLRRRRWVEAVIYAGGDPKGIKQRAWSLVNSVDDWPPFGDTAPARAVPAKTFRPVGDGNSSADDLNARELSRLKGK